LPQFLTTAEAIVNACGADLIYIDNNEELHISENFNLERYRDFMFKYLTSFKSENRLSKDILINFLNTND
jgi:hypothetical protein